MAKFKVGDFVVGNVHANKYSVTRCGWRGKVVGLEPPDRWQTAYGYMMVEGVDHWTHWVDPACFDLDTFYSESLSHPDDRAKNTGEKSYKRLVVIKITDDGATAEYIVGKNHAKGVSITRHKKDKPNDKFAALYAVSKLFGLDGTVEKFVRKDDLSDLNAAITKARGYLEDAEAFMKHITAAGK